MHSAIIAGTGIYDIPGMTFQERIIDTSYGQAKVNIGTVDGFELVFLARHGLDHSTPPHNINYRANIKALQMLGVKRVAATYAVGSANRRVRPTEMALLTDFMNFTSGRPLTFFEGGDSGLAHTAMDAPYCPAMGRKILELAHARGLAIKPDAVYVATNGPRFETPAEIRMYDRLGGDVVGMTGVPEIVLAREAGMHFAAVAYSVNWCSGIMDVLELHEEDMVETRQNLARLLVDALREMAEPDCRCADAVMVMHPAKD
jgi:5'-methylthioadenosine phosphorylase